MTRFTLVNPGGSAAATADRSRSSRAELGVSSWTAWRRLKVTQRPNPSTHGVRRFPDFDRAGRIGDFYGDPRALTFAQLLIDSRGRSMRGRSYFANFGSGSCGDD
jgi:hypothetical protein